MAVFYDKSLGLLYMMVKGFVLLVLLLFFML